MTHLTLSQTHDAVSEFMYALCEKYGIDMDVMSKHDSTFYNLQNYDGPTVVAPECIREMKVFADGLHGVEYIFLDNEFPALDVNGLDFDHED